MVNGNGCRISRSLYNREWKWKDVCKLFVRFHSKCLKNKMNLMTGVVYSMLYVSWVIAAGVMSETCFSNYCNTFECSILRLRRLKVNFSFFCISNVSTSHHIIYLSMCMYTMQHACWMRFRLERRPQTKHVTHSHASDADAESNRAHTNNTHIFLEKWKT